MAVVNLMFVALSVAVCFTSTFLAEFPGAGAAAARSWSAPQHRARVPVVEMGLRGSAGVRQAQDVLLYSTAVRRAGEKGSYQGYALGFRTNATIDHFRWVYAGEDGYTSKFQVMNGGLGFKYITLYFTSQDDHGIYYNISIYGRYDKTFQPFLEPDNTEDEPTEKKVIV
ncbi:uncharacterized protein LOC134529378 [Bacillus rossius redtenbacheri]|uniref:uncharacterized protein LOC134529378 n=1 Tax=Bacillus rossius redtenbacheri TaxID=93214 RepID=UPI002FDEBCB4